MLPELHLFPLISFWFLFPCAVIINHSKQLFPCFYFLKSKYSSTFASLDQLLLHTGNWNSLVRFTLKFLHGSAIEKRKKNQDFMFSPITDLFSKRRHRSHSSTGQNPGHHMNNFVQLQWELVFWRAPEPWGILASEGCVRQLLRVALLKVTSFKKRDLHLQTSH